MSILTVGENYLRLMPHDHIVGVIRGAFLGRRDAAWWAVQALRTQGYGEDVVFHALFGIAESETEERLGTDEAWLTACGGSGAAHERGDADAESMWAERGDAIFTEAFAKVLEDWGWPGQAAMVRADEDAARRLAKAGERSLMGGPPVPPDLGWLEHPNREAVAA